MSGKLDIDLETERINLDGVWVTREEVVDKVQKMLATGDFRIAKLSEALEQLSHTIGSAKSVTLKLTAEQYAKLESAGGRLGKSAATFGRELLMQVLDRAVAASGATPSSGITPVATYPVVPHTDGPPGKAPLPSSVSTPSTGAAPVPNATAATTSNVTAEEAAGAVTIKPKKKGDSHNSIAPVATSSSAATVPNVASVVVDQDAAGPGPGATSHPPGGDGRRWFNRS